MWVRLLILTLLAHLAAPAAAIAAPIFVRSDPNTPYLSAADIPVGFYAGGSPTARHCWSNSFSKRSRFALAFSRLRSAAFMVLV